MRSILLGFVSTLVIAAILIGCKQTPVLKTIQTNNPNYNVKLLFENDGCKVYRFLDQQSYEYVYYTDCRDNGSTVTSMQWQERRGKTERQMKSITVQ